MKPPEDDPGKSPQGDDADRYHITATTSLAGETKRVLMHDDSFAVFDRYGDVRTSLRSEQGLYDGGTRFLSTQVLSLGARPFLFLSSTATSSSVISSIVFSTVSRAIRR